MSAVPPHGTPRRYRHGPDENDQPGAGCKCARCRAAAGRAVKLHRLNGPTMTPTEPVRQHVHALKAAGMPYNSIAKVAKVPYTIVTRLLYGEPGRGIPPSRKMRNEYARAILSVAPHQHGDDALVLAAGTVRRLRALACVGWPAHRIGEHVRMHPDHIRHLTSGRAGATITVDTARRVAAAYGLLWDADPTSAGVAPARAAQVRTKALRRGWQPPAAWDDEWLDLSDTDLERELARHVSLMDHGELQRCNDAHYRLGDGSPLVVAAAREYERRKKRRTSLREAS